MKNTRLKELALATAILGLNAFIVLQVTGIAYEPFSWKAFAGTYDPGPDGGRSDDDEDGFPNETDPNPNIFDPSGCYYNLVNGQIIPGGSVQVAGPGIVTFNPDGADPMDGSLGCYNFSVNTAGQYTLTLSPPPQCELASQLVCPNLGNLNIGAAQLLDIGNPPDPGNPGFLTSNACTQYYTQLTFADTSFGVINNNFPLDCEGAEAPALSVWGMVLAVAILIAISFFSLRRREAAPA